MAKTLVDELLQLQAANDALYATNEAVSQYRNNPPWILEDIELSDQDSGFEEVFTQLKKEALARFYAEGRALRTYKEDKRCDEATNAWERIAEEFEQHNAEYLRAQEELSEANAQVDQEKEKVSEKAVAARSLERQIDNLKHELDRERKIVQKRIELNTARAEEKKIAAEKKAEKDAQEEVAKYKSYLKTDRLSIGEIIKWLLVGLLVGLIACEIIQALVTGISGNVNLGALCGLLSFFIGLFLPLGISMKGAIEERKWDRQELKKAKKEAQQKIEEIRNSDASEDVQKKQQDGFKSLANKEQSIVALQDKLKQATEDERNEHEVLNRIEENRARCESNFKSIQKVVEALSEKMHNAEREADQAFEAFLFSLNDEFLAAKEQERKRFEATIARMELLLFLRKMSFDRAFTLSSVDAVYNPSDLENLPRVIDKLQLNRATTLSEALNAVDADLRAERMHAEQMAATRRHNEQMAAHERERNRILEEQAKAELEIQEKRAAQEAEHQAAMAQAAQDQADAELERLAAEEERWAEEQAANIEMLRMQSEQTAAQQEAAAAEAQRLLEQQQAYQQAAENEELERQERISDNLNHCRHCIHAPYPINEYTYCEYGGWDCKDADRCMKYQSA